MAFKKDHKKMLESNLVESNLNDHLLKLIGTSITDMSGEVLGQVMEITRNADDASVEYVIVQGTSFFGRGSRFFAIAASATHFGITKDGRVALKLHKDDIQFADGVSADQCPKPRLPFGHSVYELYNYTGPDNATANEIATNKSNYG